MSGFCRRCEVSLDLHAYPGEEDYGDCRSAETKADLLTCFGRPVFRSPAASPVTAETNNAEEAK